MVTAVVRPLERPETWDLSRHSDELAPGVIAHAEAEAEVKP